MRKIAVFSGSRAEYGILVPVLRAIEADPALHLLLVSGGTHLTGAAEFAVAAEVAITRQDETPGSTPRAIGQGVLDLVDAFQTLAPDIVLIYGDRFEAFAAMIAATQMQIPTAHVEGGDLTQGGTLDDVVRHAMSKLAHVHFTTNDDAAKRLRTMGEESWRVHNVGFPPVDLIRDGQFADPHEVTEALGLEEDAPVILFTQHPISTSPGSAKAEIDACMKALARARQDLGAQVVLTHPNGDIGSDVIIEALEAFATNHSGTVLRASLGRHLYHGVLNFCGKTKGVCVGNSSSGLKETLAFKCPAVDIGPRQNGRLRGENVLHVACKEGPIFDAIRRCIEDQAFRDRLQTAENPYGRGDAGPQIAETLRRLDLDDPRLLPKQTVL